jgi:macrolide-specific efflux system membrane fusion protein
MAPIDGMVIQKNIEPGQTFTSSEPILILSDRLTINSQVDETDIGQIKVGQSATVNLDAYSQTKIEARVDKIAFEATTINNVTTYIVELVPEKVPDYMLSGMTANVTFHVAALKQVITVSSAALKVKGEDFYVLILPDAQSEGACSLNSDLFKCGPE